MAAAAARGGGGGRAGGREEAKGTRFRCFVLEVGGFALLWAVTSSPRRHGPQSVSSSCLWAHFGRPIKV